MSGLLTEAEIPNDNVKRGHSDAVRAHGFWWHGREHPYISPIQMREIIKRSQSTKPMDICLLSLSRIYGMLIWLVGRHER
jgi:hypothetical protein